MRKTIAASIVAAAIVATALPANASHPAHIYVANAFAGTCGGNPGSGAVAAGACVFGQDPIWDSTGPTLGPANCRGGTTTSGCGAGVYLPGFGPPVVRPLNAFNATGGCANGSDPACWRGGNFLFTTGHPAATCLIARGAVGGSGACQITLQGSVYRGVSGVGAYSGSSEACGRMRLEQGTTALLFDMFYVHSAGTLLPIMYRGLSHVGISAYELTSARSIRQELGEPQGLGNGGLPSADPSQGPGRSGTQRFGATSINVGIPGSGQPIEPGPGADAYCSQF